MAIEYVDISPLDLRLDLQNPRYLKKIESDEDMREYLIEHEDSLKIARSISDRGLVAGDIVVAMKEDNVMTVLEGNRRVSSMQMFLNRSLIPKKYEDAFPPAEDNVLRDITTIKIQVVDSREESVSIMVTRHITGIKSWSPLAKRKFFASRFESGQSISDLSETTNLSASEIRQDIREFKFFMSTMDKHNKAHPENQIDITKVEIDRFLRIFGIRTTVAGEQIGVKTLLKISYDENENTISSLDPALFEALVQHIFYEAFVTGKVNTRSRFEEIPDIDTFMARILDEDAPGDEEDDPESSEPISGKDKPPKTKPKKKKTEKGGGDEPGKFFHCIVWRNKLSNQEPLHQGLLKAVFELRSLSNDYVHTEGSRNSKATPYVRYCISAGMTLRVAYEQSLKLWIKHDGKWDIFKSIVKSPREQTLSNMESFVMSSKNNVTLTEEMTRCLNKIQRGFHRELLNDNTHNTELITVSGSILEGFAEGGMRGFIQEVINNLPDVTPKK